jgi:hypothetical protein
VDQQGWPTRRLVMTLADGEFLGHELLLTDMPYPVSERALNDARVYKLYRPLRHRRSQATLTLGVFGVAFVMFAALAVHAAGGFEDVLRVEAAQGSRLQDLIHRVLGDHHPLSSVRDGKRFIDGAIEDPDYAPSRTRTGHKTQVRTSRRMFDGAVILARMRG